MKFIENKKLFLFVALVLTIGLNIMLIACGNATISDFARSGFSAAHDSGGDDSKPADGGGDGGDDGGGGDGGDDGGGDDQIVNPPPDEDGGTVLWTFDVDYSFHCSPAVANGNVYLGGNTFYCLDAVTGEEKWSYDEDIVGSTAPAIMGEYVYGGGGQGYYCFNAATGVVVWQTESPSSVPAALSDKYVYLARAGTVRCLDALTGEEIWFFNSGTNIVGGNSAPVVSGGNVYYIDSNSTLFCLDAESGDKVWEVDDQNCDSYSSPAIVDGDIYMGTSIFHLFRCLDAADGSLKWECSVGDSIGNAPAITRTQIFVITEKPEGFNLNRADGSEVWMIGIPNFEWSGQVYESSPAVAGNYIYFGKAKNLFCYEADTGSPVWSFMSNEYVFSSPAVVDGRVYFMNGWNDQFYCISAKESYGKNWPMYKYDKERSGYTSD